MYTVITWDDKSVTMEKNDVLIGEEKDVGCRVKKQFLNPDKRDKKDKYILSTGTIESVHGNMVL